MECALTWLDSGECLSFSVSGVAMDQLLDDESDAAEVMKQAVNHKGSLNYSGRPIITVLPAFFQKKMNSCIRPGAILNWLRN